MITLGILLIVFGWLVVVFFAFVFSTSIGGYYNLGLLLAQLIGVLCGLGLVGMGTVFAAAGYIVRYIAGQTEPTSDQKKSASDVSAELGI